MTIHQRNFSRRSLLQGAAGLVIAFHLPREVRAQAAAPAARATPFAPNAFIRIGADNTVTILSKHIEFGQGPFTGLATIVAEELDADWSQMRAEHAPADAKLYNNTAFGPIQGTGGSTAIANSWGQMRKAGATARAMIVAAAAAEWQVPAAEITVRNGVVRHEGSRKSKQMGHFAAAAAKPNFSIRYRI